MAKPTLLELLNNRPVLCDGGMGTQLMLAGLPTGACGVLWNVDNPDAVKQVHTHYRNAGCDIVTTNTFQGSSQALMMHGLQDRVAELNGAAAKIASEAAGDDGYAMADIGPFGGFLEPLGDTTVEQLTAIFTEQLAAMYDNGADGAIIETMSDTNEIAVAVKAAKSLDSNKPVIATYAFEKGAGSFNTMMGTSAADAMKAVIDAGADIVGSNCGTSLSLDDYLALAEQLVAGAGDVPVILQPNAGSPVVIDGETVHTATPEDMAAIVPKLLDIGIKVIGGCCGTTPAHLDAMGKVMGK